MGVFIKDMEMPTSCAVCDWSRYVGNGRAMCLKTSMTEKTDVMSNRRPDWCPLIEVQSPHGRLGDLDELWDKMSKYTDNEGAKMPFGYDDQLIHRDSACFMIENAPTVIEAEGSKL